MPGRINERLFLQGKFGRVRMGGIGKQTENVEHAQSECDNNVVSLRGTREECRRGIKKIREGLFVMKKSKENLYATFRTKER